MTTTKQNPFREYTEFLYFSDIPTDQQKEIREDYNHLDESEFFGHSWIFVPMGKDTGYYHMSDFLRWGTPWTGERPAEYSGFTGYYDSSYGHALLILLSDDGRYFLAWSNELPPEPEELLEDRHGIYIPKLFTEAYAQLLSPQSRQALANELTECQGPHTSKYYWECWEEILDYAELEIDGQLFSLYQDQDLFATPQGYDPEVIFDLQQG